MPTTVYAKSEGARFTTGKHTNLVVVTCTCGLLFAIPEGLYDSAKAHRGPNGWQISCPLGHTWHYTGDDLSVRLQKELDAERDYSARLNARLDQSEASLSATKGVVTKLKKRVAGGACPCCNRTFENLGRHMATKHPEFVESEHVPEVAVLAAGEVRCKITGCTNVARQRGRYAYLCLAHRGQYGS